jgi:hypothetical protein
MRRAEAGETISQEEVKAAVRISRANCVPVALPPAIKLVRASQSWFAEPTKEPLAKGLGERRLAGGGREVSES